MTYAEIACDFGVLQMEIDVAGKYKFIFPGLDQ